MELPRQDHRQLKGLVISRTSYFEGEELQHLEEEEMECLAEILGIDLTSERTAAAA